MSCCECGCGAPAPIAVQTNTALGYVKGEPCRFVAGHNKRTRLSDYEERDMGFTSPCWVWLGPLDDEGYAHVSRGGHRLAHRAVYTEHRGPIPEGLTLDHLCRVRHCVNPWHLEPVTSGVNTLRGEGFAAVNARKTHCIHGHPLDGVNLIVRSGGGRKCRTCQRAAVQRCDARRRARAA